MLQIQICYTCKIDKPITEFWRDSRYPKGYRVTCKSCSKVKRKPIMGSKTTYISAVNEKDLPTPDRLPALYLKKCADYWSDVVGGTEPVKRVA